MTTFRACLLIGIAVFVAGCSASDEQEAGSLQVSEGSRPIAAGNDGPKKTGGSEVIPSHKTVFPEKIVFGAFEPATVLSIPESTIPPLPPKPLADLDVAFRHYRANVTTGEMDPVGLELARAFYRSPPGAWFPSDDRNDGTEMDVLRAARLAVYTRSDAARDNALSRLAEHAPRLAPQTILFIVDLLVTRAVLPPGVLVEFEKQRLGFKPLPVSESPHPALYHLVDKSLPDLNPDELVIVPPQLGEGYGVFKNPNVAVVASSELATIHSGLQQENDRGWVNALKIDDPSSVTRNFSWIGTEQARFTNHLRRALLVNPDPKLWSASGFQSTTDGTAVKGIIQTPWEGITIEATIPTPMATSGQVVAMVEKGRLGLVYEANMARRLKLVGLYFFSDGQHAFAPLDVDMGVDLSIGTVLAQEATRREEHAEWQEKEDRRLAIVNAEVAKEREQLGWLLKEGAVICGKEIEMLNNILTRGVAMGETCFYAPSEGRVRIIREGQSTAYGNAVYIRRENGSTGYVNGYSLH